MDLRVVSALVETINADSEPELLSGVVNAALAGTSSLRCLGLAVGADGEPTLVIQAPRPRESLEEPPPSAPAGVLREVLDGRVVRLDADSDRHVVAGSWLSYLCDGPVLAMPLRTEGDVLGAICVSRPAGSEPYDASVSADLEVLATCAAVLLRRMRRQVAADQLVNRLRRPRAHDKTSVVSELAPSATLRRLLTTTRDVVGLETAFVFSRAADGEVVRVGSLEVESRTPTVLSRRAAEALARLTVEGLIPPSVPDLSAHPLTAASAEVGATSGAYCGVPIRHADGATVGAVCAMSDMPQEALGTSALYGLRALAGLIATELDAARQEDIVRRRDQDDYRARIASMDRQIYLQPIFHLESGKLVGYEALSRFLDIDGVFQRPDLEFAEATRLGLGAWLEQDMLRMALSNLEAMPSDTYLSVNLSPAALSVTGSRELLLRAVCEHPNSLVLELTEHEEVTDYDSLSELLETLRQRGLRLAVDDAGAGYASLQHVVRVRPDILKLDAVFGREIVRDQACRAAARALIGFAQEMGASLVAEGIETIEERDVLRSLGATYGQGYLLGRPAPATEVLTVRHRASRYVREASRASRSGRPSREE